MKTGALWGNVSALFLIQIFNQILPLLVIPHLTNVLGVKLYGVVAFCFLIAQIASVITDFGFNLSVIPKISLARENTKTINRIIGAVFSCKLLLSLVVTFFIIIYAGFSEDYSAYKNAILIVTLMIFGQAFQPIWLFHGLEKMVNVTIFVLVARIIYVLLVITLVNGPEDYIFAIISNGLSHVGAAVVAYILMKREGYKPVWPGIKEVQNTIIESTQYFWSRAAVSLYTSGAGLFLGLISGPVQVAYYSAAEQMYRGAQSLLTPFSQAIYPNLIRTKNFRLFFKLTILLTLACVAGAVFALFTGKWFIVKIFGVEFLESYRLLVVFLGVLIVTTPSVMFGYPFLGALGKSHVVNHTVFYAAALQASLMALIWTFDCKSAIFMAFSILATECIVLTARLYYSKNFYKKYLKQDGIS